jgi:glycosyltransferase involved in cell wall biosynthesis
LNIIHCISAPAAGGAEIYVKDLAISMVGIGHKVHICFLSHASEVGRDIEFEKKFLDDLRDNHISFSFIGNKARKNPFFGFMKLRGLVKDFKADILHCHLYYMVIFSLGIKKTRVIYTHHNIKLNAHPFIYKLLNLRVSTYIGICSKCTDLLKTVTKKDVVRIDNAVNESKIIKQSASVSKSKSIKVVMVGGLAEQKNYFLMLKAINHLKDLDFQLVIAGEGPLKKLITEEINKLNISNKVTLIGNCNDVPKLLSQGDIFAMSSIWEGLPISLLEATLTGMPVIVTNVGGCSEVVHNCYNGIVIDDLNPVSYSRGLRKLIESNIHREFYSNNAINNSAMYTISHSLKKHLDLYGQV